MPPGYRLGRLKPHHASLIAQHWFLEYSSKLTEKFLYYNLSRFDSIAVFDAKRTDFPAAWMLYKAGGMLGIQCTLPQYREKGFSRVIQAKTLWMLLLNKHPGFGEVDDKSLFSTELKHCDILGRSICIWNYSSV